MTMMGRAQQPAVSVIDILDRVLDKGLVVAGDISISLANVELLTIRIRLLVCSIDKAEQIGLNWWRYDRKLAMSGPGDGQLDAIEARLRRLEKEAGSAPASRPATATTRKRASGRRK